MGFGRITELAMAGVWGMVDYNPNARFKSQSQFLCLALGLGFGANLTLRRGHGNVGSAGEVAGTPHGFQGLGVGIMFARDLGSILGLVLLQLW